MIIDGIYRNLSARSQPATIPGIDRATANDGAAAFSAGTVGRVV